MTTTGECAKGGYNTYSYNIHKFNQKSKFRWMLDLMSIPYVTKIEKERKEYREKQEQKVAELSQKRFNEQSFLDGSLDSIEKLKRERPGLVQLIESHEATKTEAKEKLVKYGWELNILPCLKSIMKHKFVRNKKAFRLFLGEFPIPDEFLERGKDFTLESNTHAWLREIDLLYENHSLVIRSERDEYRGRIEDCENTIEEAQGRIRDIDNDLGELDVHVRKKREVLAELDKDWWLENAKLKLADIGDALGLYFMERSTIRKLSLHFTPEGELERIHCRKCKSDEKSCPFSGAVREYLGSFLEKHSRNHNLESMLKGQKMLYYTKEEDHDGDCLLCRDKLETNHDLLLRCKKCKAAVHYSCFKHYHPKLKEKCMICLNGDWKYECDQTMKKVFFPTVKEIKIR